MPATSLPGQIQAERRRSAQAALERAAIGTQVLSGTGLLVEQSQSRGCGPPVSPPLPLRPPPSPPSPSLETAAGKQQNLRHH